MAETPPAETSAETPAPPPPPAPRLSGRRSDNTGLVVGVLLVVVGALFLVGEFWQVEVGQYGWPFFVIVPGLVLLGIGAGVRSASGLAIPGAIVTMTGVVLLVQNLTGLWASWAYAWALVAPGGVGLGIMVQGLALRNPSLVASGARVARTGAVIFLVGFAFFEGALHLDGADFGIAGKIALPALLVLVGVWLLVRNLASGGRRL